MTSPKSQSSLCMDACDMSRRAEAADGLSQGRVYCDVGIFLSGLLPDAALIMGRAGINPRLSIFETNIILLKGYLHERVSALSEMQFALCL